VSSGSSDRFRFNPADLDPDLSLEDTIAPRGYPASGRSTTHPVIGYDPYDRTGAAKPPPQQPGPRRGFADLRKLSNWIRLQRQVKALKKDQPE
jgi:hypothetical protein